MITERARRTGRRLFAVALLPLALLGFLTARRVRELAAEPVGEKDCPPLVPWPADTGKPTRLVVAAPRPLHWTQRGGTVNDASCLNRTPVHGVVEVRDVEDVRAALALARDNGLKISLAGVRHSMGGHAFARGALVLDMRRLDRMALDVQTRSCTARIPTPRASFWPSGAGIRASCSRARSTRGMGADRLSLAAFDTAVPATQILTR